MPPRPPERPRDDAPPPAVRAAGFVLVRAAAGGHEVLLLRNRERGEWGLPKGHAEPGEDDLATARRETEEETGLTDVAPDPWFSRTLRYEARRRGQRTDKTVTYLLARLRGSGEVRLSREHDAAAWVSVREALARAPYPALGEVLREAGLFLKDASLFDAEPGALERARRHLTALPGADARLVAHLEGGARLAQRFAEGLRRAGVTVDVEATAAGTLLHDVGRALGEHDDHQRAGLRHLRTTPLAPYGFACISHFTKGADVDDLVAAGVPRATAEDFRRLIDGSALTWEERCAALADACMQGPEAVAPAKRFADLRRRYDAPRLIDLQERLTEQIRAALAAATGHDPVRTAGLD